MILALFLAAAPIVVGVSTDSPPNAEQLTAGAWTSQSIGSAAEPWKGVAFGGGIFCTVSAATGSLNYSSATTPDGVTWTTYSTIVSPNAKAVAYSPSLGVFSAVGGSPSFVAAGSDCQTWTLGTYPIGANVAGLVWDSVHAVFIAIRGNGGLSSESSADGITYTDSGKTGTGASTAIASCGGTTVGTIPFDGNLFRSTDGSASWVSAAGSVQIGGEIPACSDALHFVAVGNSGGTGYADYSTDGGDNWTPATGIGGMAPSTVIWDGSEYVAVGKSTTNWATSPDGVTWTVLDGAVSLAAPALAVNPGSSAPTIHTSGMMGLLWAFNGPPSLLDLAGW